MSEIRVNTFKAEDGISAPSFPNGIQVTGVVTATSLASSVPHLNVGDNIQLGASGVTTSTTFVGALSGNATGLSGTPNISVGSVTASTGTFSGNVSIGGTLTYEDVLNIDSVGIVTAREGMFIPDDKEVKIGNTAGSPDLKILHTGGHSRIRNSTGQLTLAGSDVGITNAAETQTMIKVSGSAAELLYANNTKLATTNTGVTVTGTVTDDKGNVRSIPKQTNSGSHTLQATTAGKVLYTDNNTNVPNSVFSAGDAVTIINNSGSSVTITQNSGVTMYFTSDGTSGNRTLGARGMVTIWFADASTAYISGSGLT